MLLFFRCEVTHDGFIKTRLRMATAFNGFDFCSLEPLRSVAIHQPYYAKGGTRGPKGESDSLRVEGSATRSN